MCGNIFVTTASRPDNLLSFVPGADDFLGVVSRRQLFELIVGKIKSLQMDEPPGHHRGQSIQAVG